MTLVSGIVGLALLAAFSGIMLVWVPAPPLIIITVGVFALLVYDLVRTLRYGD